MADDLATIALLERKLAGQSFRFRLLEAYYEGENRLRARGLAIPPELDALSFVVNWPSIAVDSLDERLDVEGFRIAGQSGTDNRLWSWWQANNLDEQASPIHTEALVHGRAFLVVGPNELDPTTPIITAESSRHIAVDVDPRTRSVLSALRLYEVKDGRAMSAALYLPDVTRYYDRSPLGSWTLTAQLTHRLGVVPVVPMVNRARLAQRNGRSEMHNVMGLTDAACRTLMNLQGAQELMAVPQRYVLGATEQDFRDANGNPIPAWEAYLGRIFALENENAKMGQFTAADLRNFTTVVEHYARHVSSMTGVPAHYLGFTTENPASADAIRNGEARLVKRAERRQVAFSGAWERAMRIGLRLVDGTDTAERLETVWRDPATPTYAAKADAVTKLFTAGIIPLQVAWEDMGYSAERRRVMAELMDNDPTARLSRLLDELPTEPAPTAAGA